MQEELLSTWLSMFVAGVTFQKIVNVPDDIKEEWLKKYEAVQNNVN